MEFVCHMDRFGHIRLKLYNSYIKGDYIMMNEMLLKAKKFVMECGNVTDMDCDFIRVSYENVNKLLSDAQRLNYLGYITRINRKCCEMHISII